ncbi:MAG TPA: hypothetical protein ENN06_01135 [Desulfobacteraceae bacterium]|nr:hypothetical protein [Desulfobacteraceae bacterium]
MRRLIFVGFIIAVLLAGCYSKPVRHLASDASLIRAGESTRQDVLRYIGEPDGHRTVAPGVEEYVYHEERKNILGRTPLLGSVVGKEGDEMLIITLTGDRVSNVEFRTVGKGDRDWADDFTWEEIR